MTQQPDISEISALIGEPARAKMLIALLGGKALTATEMALEADILPPTASVHLAKLLDCGLLRVQKQGRHKYFQLRGPEVAELLEALLNLSSKMEHSTVSTGPRDPDLRVARVCYDHLAGEQGVSLLVGLERKGLIKDDDGQLSLTANGSDWFDRQGADIELLSKERRPLCKGCLDWSERRYHLAGTLGRWVLQDIFAKRWAVQDLDSRIVRFSGHGLRQFNKVYALNS